VQHRTPLPTKAVSLSRIERLRGSLPGKDSLIDELIDLFVADLPGRLAAITQAVQHADARALLLHAHALRGGAANAFSAASATTVNTNGTLDLGGFAQTMLTVLHGDERREGLYPGFLERYADAYVAELRDFVGGVPERRPPGVTGEDGRRALAIALAAERAASTARPVTPE